MKNYHFWFSQQMMEMYLLEGKEPNKCMLQAEGESVEVEYTHCHGKYIEAGGSKWGDEVYLGVGDITYIGKDPSLDKPEEEWRW